MSKSDDFFPYSASPLIVNLRGGVHFPMTIPYNLFAFYAKTSSISLYFLTRISHIFILIFDYSSVLVSSFGMCLFSKFGNGSFRSVNISTMSSALWKFFRTSYNLSKLTPWSSILVISLRTAFNSGVYPLKYFCYNPLVPPSLPRLKFPLRFPLRLFPLSLFVGVGVADTGVAGAGDGGSTDSFPVSFMIKLI